MRSFFQLVVTYMMDRPRLPLGGYYQLLQRRGLLCGDSPLAADLTRPVALVSCDSKRVIPGTLFLCKGARFKAVYLRSALEQGAFAYVSQTPYPDVPLPCIQVTDIRQAMGLLADAAYGHPSGQLRITGITGTKGKTTTTYLMKAILEKAGFKTGLIGTTGNLIGDRSLPSNMTTPDPVDLHRCLRQMVDEGVEAVSMEVSAHAVDMHRVDGITFEAACYTNFSQDHLDYFGTMEKYFETKKRFFIEGSALNAALNADDETSASIIRDLKVPYLTYGIRAEADVFARDSEISEDGVAFSIRLRGLENMSISMHLTGMFNVYNALAAASLAMIMGIDKSAIREGLESVKNVPGRVEILDTRTPYKVILDYAHSPDALENVLTTVRAFTRSRLIVLFGCGGDRDHGKRPIMGEIVGRLADFSILTSDNPRTEDPDAILRSIEQGMKRTQGRYVVIENRREAIRYALEMGREGDVIILAGKGNETYQDIMGVKRPFDEKVVVRELLAEMRA